MGLGTRGGARSRGSGLGHSWVASGVRGGTTGEGGWWLGNRGRVPQADVRPAGRQDGVGLCAASPAPAAPQRDPGPGADDAGRGTHLVQWPRWGSPKGRGRGHWVLCCRRPRSPPAAQLLNALLVASAPPGALVLGRPARAPQSAARALRPAPGEGPVPGSHEGGNPPAPPPAGPPARSARKNGLERWAWDSVAPSRTPGLGTRRLHRLHRGERRELTSPLSGRHQLFLGPE